tara:strand:+ start:640 stop:1014 length:375 start_codon:yes stop_codon:yes gene_type:complete
MVMISILIIAFINSLSKLLPDDTDLLRFFIINLSGFLLFSYSIHKGKYIKNPKRIWYNNSFICSGITLILYANVMLTDAIHTYALPIFYLCEIVVSIYIGGRLRLESDYQIFQEMTDLSGTQGA